jgi:hypothetical protein
MGHLATRSGNLTADVIGRSIAYTVLNSAIFLLPFLLVRALATKLTKARGRRAGPVGAMLVGVATVLPGVLAVRFLFGPILHLGSYILAFAVAGGAAAGLVYWTLGGFETGTPASSG